MSGKKEVLIIFIILYLCQETVQHDEIEDNLLSIKNNLNKLKKYSMEDLQSHNGLFASVFDEFYKFQNFVNNNDCKCDMANTKGTLTISEMFYYQKDPIEMKGFEYYVRLERFKNGKSKENLIKLISEINRFQSDYQNHAPELFETLDIFIDSLIQGDINEQVEYFLNNTQELETFKILDSLMSIKLQTICLKIMKNRTKEDLNNETNLFEAFSTVENLNHLDLQNLGFNKLVKSLNKSENEDLVQELMEKADGVQRIDDKIVDNIFEIWKQILIKIPLNVAIQKIKYFRIMKFQTKSLNCLMNVSKGKNILLVVDYIMDLEYFNSVGNGKLVSDLVNNIPYNNEYLEKIMTDSNSTYDEFSSQKLQTLSLKSELKRLMHSNDPRVIEIAYDLIVKYESGGEYVSEIIDLLPKNIKILIHEKEICIKNNGRYLYSDDTKTVKISKDSKKPKYAIWKLGKIYSNHAFYIIHQETYRYILPKVDSKKNTTLKVELNYDNDLGSVWQIIYKDSFARIQFAYDNDKFLMAGKTNVHLKNSEKPTKWDIEIC